MGTEGEEEENVKERGRGERGRKSNGNRGKESRKIEKECILEVVKKKYKIIKIY